MSIVMLSFRMLQPVFGRNDMLDRLLKATSTSKREHGLGFAVENGSVYFGSIVQGTRHEIYLDVPEGDVGGTLHTHPDQPKNPTLSVMDATTLLTEDAEFAAVVGWDTVEVMRKPYSIFQDRALRVLQSILVRIELHDMSYLSGRAEMRVRFPLLFETRVRR